MRTLSVTQTHSLGRVAAIARLSELGAKSKADKAFELIDVTFDDDAIIFTVIAYTQTVHGRLYIKDEYVKIETDPLPWIAVLAIPFAKSQIQSKLAEALK